MNRGVRVPQALKSRPFTLAEARAIGLDRKHLSGRTWRHLASELYCWRGWIEEPWELLTTWQQLMPTDAVFGGKTAAWILGLGTTPTSPIEVIAPTQSGVRSRKGLHVRRCALEPDEVCSARMLRTTTLLRTLRDLCCHLSRVEALVVLDVALRLGLTDPTSVTAYAFDMAGRPGASRLKALASLAEPAESPMETRLRWLMLDAGLPRPKVQSELHDANGRFVGRADLFYPDARLVIEYDGANHGDRLVEDNRRQNELINAGFRLLRFTAPDLAKPLVVASAVRQALAERCV